MHVDEFIDYGTSIVASKRSLNEDYARWVLCHFRMPATLKMDFKEFMKDNKLFCDYKNESYRVTGASRLGDVWLSKDFEQTVGYQLRVDIEDCSNWSKEL